MNVESDLIDLTRSARVLTAQSPLSDLPLRRAVRVQRDCPVAEAVAIMERSGVSSLLVDGDGIVTERDIARGLCQGTDPAAAVESVTVWHPLSVTASVSVVDAAATMLNEHLRHLIVTMPGDVAVVSLRDLTAVLLQATTPDLWLASLRVAVDGPAEIWLG
jgi:signal-transduction protein with cAMP-binding, CBS, and nucleotidyltransferase domain